MLINHCHLIGKNTSKSVERDLRRGKHPFVTGLLHSNAVLRTEMMLKSLNAQTRLLHREKSLESKRSFRTPVK